MTNTEKIASDIDVLADLIYRADDINPNICKADFNDVDELVNCPYLMIMAVGNVSGIGL